MHVQKITLGQEKQMYQVVLYIVQKQYLGD